MSATLLFPLGAILVTLLSYYFPSLLIPYTDYLSLLLGILMFGMGLGLRFENFAEILRRPKIILIGVVLQFLFMPFIAFAVARLFTLDQSLLIGLVLVGACPGGIASNVVCYLARGDVALSIMITVVSTVLAVVLTPTLTWLYLGQQVNVPVASMMINIFIITLLPVAAGVLLNHYLGKRLQLLKKVFPLLSMVAIMLIIGIVMALTQPQIHMAAIPVLATVFWQNVLGLVAGYYLAKWLGLDEKICRTIAIEVGMQNGGLASGLAEKLGKAATMGLAPAVFGPFMNITGSILASYWHKKEPKD
jgi:BASS family bile acid:Na+ symporter